MNTLRKKILILGLTIAAVALLASCSDDNDDNINNGQGNLQLKISSTLPNSTGKTYINSRGINSTLEISDFLINIKEFELELDDDYYDEQNNGYYGFEDEIELEGPFLLDVLSNEFTIVDVAIPNGVYEEIEFEFDKSADSGSILFNKSILINGNIDGVPFEFWHDFEDEIEVDFEDTDMDIVINNDNNQLVINFDLTGVFNGISGVDLSEAVDGNGNGVIEISPIDTDGNNQIAQQIKEKIKLMIDLLDD
ncbi:hypothetical protein OS188_10655 [Xanthomarina sp. F1114]|uniref:hypothetical protein n=1 Tax=Xanthomarina sp. F1114 TaxID=2996019 RepID=UPI00225E18E4|nr:hypothetical protein [Xanthomarina sp. F1114]MCX7548410.1 hypothetical protein [Xanthomarina sp. F1114]